MLCICQGRANSKDTVVLGDMVHYLICGLEKYNFVAGWYEWICRPDQQLTDGAVCLVAHRRRNNLLFGFEQNNRMDLKCQKSSL